MIVPYDRPENAADNAQVYLMDDGTYTLYNKIGEPIQPGGYVPYDIFTQGRRVLARRTSPDGSVWTDSETIVQPDWRDPQDLQFMELSPGRVQDGYIGVLTTYHNLSQTIDLQLAGSVNGRTWCRPSREPALPVARLGTRWRRLPAPARRTFAARTDDLAAAVSSPRIPGIAVDATVAYFPGCMTDRLYPAMGEAVVRVLRACGAKVVFPDLPGCCGLPAINAGDPDSAREPARRLIESFERVAADHILSSSSSCVVAILNDYPRLFRDDPAWAARAAAVAGRLVDFSGFMARFAKLPAGALAGDTTATVTYHDACQTNYVLGTVAEQRHLITDVLGLQLIEMDDADLCCGFGGSFSFDHPEIAGRLAHRKLDRAGRTGAPIIVTDNPGCVLQLRGAGAARGEATEVLHLAELVARHLPG